ncbi:hypothetical protein C8R43DRAFT_1038551 [Mycena crocata]|nr:hypothetical protein C8R43DRAFT_1038551 [Mycena crocata]
MDRKLHMPEVLNMIFAYLGSPEVHFNQDVLKDLAALARTCKTFQEPALDALWSFQGDIIPALSCFPEDLWDRSVEPEKTSFLGFRRPLVPTDWERPLVYWTRIRNFRIMKFSPTIVSPDACQALQLCCPGSCLFPNLQKIRWLVDDPVVFPLMAIFLAPRMHSIDITLIPGESMVQLSLLPTLAVRYPNLTEVALSERHRTTLGPSILQSIAALVCNLPRLESFYVSTVDSIIFDHIARLRSLRYLVISELLNSSLAGRPERIGLEPCFPSLETLTLWSTTPKITVALIRAMPRRPLTELRVIFETDFLDIHSSAELYSALARHCSHSTLKYLSLQEESCYAAQPTFPPSEEEFDDYVVPPATLRLLFAFTNLTKVKLCTYFGFDLDDATVIDMARAWPFIRKLELEPYFDVHLTPHRTGVTMAGIQAIATHCLDLKKLAIFFDAKKIPSASVNIRPQTKLVYLDVFCSPISSSASVTTFLSETFPNLGRINAHCFKCELAHTRSSAVRRWNEVQKLIEGESEDG